VPEGFAARRIIIRPIINNEIPAYNMMLPVMSGTGRDLNSKSSGLISIEAISIAPYI
jgi:hypothetical protein